jgi:23S rRNA pseudouridine1911/1915/1917 synthase
MEAAVALYSILYEDEDILIANKLAPIPVQPEKTGDSSLQDLLRAELAERRATSGKPGEVFLEAAHRVDRRASGAVLFAKTHIALSTLDAAFRDKRISKTYLACVEREPESPKGRLEHRLIWDKRRNVVRAVAATDPKALASSKAGAAAKGRKPTEARAELRGKSAILEYEVVGKSERYYFISVDLITGRHHQIRAQLSAIGCPIRGDLKYGARRSSPSGLIMLHARRLSLAQPRTEERIEVEAPFPEAEPLWAALGAQDATPA